MNNKTVEISVSSVGYNTYNDYSTSVAYVRIDSIISVEDIVSVADERNFSRLRAFTTVMHYVNAKLQGVHCQRGRKFRELLQRLK